MRLVIMQSMGHVYVTVKLSDLARTRGKEVLALVDTGATLTVIPQEIAAELGLELLAKEEVETGAGVIELNRSVSRIAIDAKEAVQEVLVSDIISKILIGSVTLETLALSIDPLTGRLKERRLLLY